MAGLYGIFVALVVCLVCFIGKLVALPVWVLCFYAWIRCLRSDSRGRLVFLGVGIGLLLAVILQPLDVHFGRADLRYRVVPIVYGYPSDHAKQQARAGKCILGGCAVWPFHPRYVFCL